MMRGRPCMLPRSAGPGRPAGWPPVRMQGAVLGCVLRSVLGSGLMTGFIAGLALAATALLAAPPSPEDIELRVQAITDQLRCPTCQAISVKDSEAAFSVQIRDKVKRMVEEGQSDDQIKAYFVARYGEWILRAPQKQGLGLVVWVLPFAAILAVGAALAWTIVRRSRARSLAASAPWPAAPLTSEQRERVQADLKRFEEED